MDPYATHLEALVGAALATAGPILELGCGDYSTPVLAAFAREQKRPYRAQASDQAWAARYRPMVEVEIVDWSTWSPPPGPWGLVLLDSEEHVRERIRRLPALAEVAQVVVLRDADVAAGKPEWERMVKPFRSVWMHTRWRPWTAVLRA